MCCRPGSGITVSSAAPELRLAGRRGVSTAHTPLVRAATAAALAAFVPAWTRICTGKLTACGTPWASSRWKACAAGLLAPSDPVLGWPVFMLRGGNGESDHDHQPDDSRCPASLDDERGPALPGAAVGGRSTPDPVAVKHRPPGRQQYWQQGDRRGHCRQRDDHAPEADALEKLHRNDEQRQHPHGDRQPAEHHGAAGVAAGGEDRVMVVPTVLAFLAPAGDDRAGSNRSRCRGR